MSAATQNEMERLVRVNREQQALLDQIYQYVDEQGLAKLGQSRVKALIEAHKRAVEALTELCDEIDNHEIHNAISKTNILWFKRKARAALAAAPKPESQP